MDVAGGLDFLVGLVSVVGGTTVGVCVGICCVGVLTGGGAGAFVVVAVSSAVAALPIGSTFGNVSFG